MSPTPTRDTLEGRAYTAILTDPSQPRWNHLEGID